MPDLSQTPDEQIVTMTIPVDEPQGEQVSIIAETVEPIQSDKTEDIPHEHTPETQPDGQIKCVSCGKYGFMQRLDPENSKEEEPQKHAGGRPCLYCEKKETYQKKTAEYIKKFIDQEGDDKSKKSVPYTEELALRLGHHRETIMEWAKNEADHPEFSDTVKILKTIQALRLQQRTLGRYNPTGAIFLLKANHNFMESEKKILAGDRTEPLTIEIIEEDK